MDAEEQIKHIMADLKKGLSDNIIAVIYNPCSEEGIKQQDCEFLRYILDKVKYHNPIFILAGGGGDFSPGIMFPRIIRRYIGGYSVFVPRVCGSALCYTILKADNLFLGKNSEITQIDPKFTYEGEELRAIKHLHSPKEDLRMLARQAFDAAQQQVQELCGPPSIFKFENLKPAEFQHVEFIASYFMNKEGHEDTISRKEMDELEIKYTFIKDGEIDDLANNLVMACQDFTVNHKVRVIFVSSQLIFFEKGEEGTFLCPLR